MNEHPLTVVIICGLALYLANIWGGDYRRASKGVSSEKALPGATPVGRSVIILAIIGALVILVVETAGEYALGVSGSQSNITWLFLPAMIAAGFIEELIFRGYLVVTKRGRRALVASIIGFSLLFALGHVQYWIEWKGPDKGYFEIILSAKSAWTLLILFVNSLWFYTVRFFPLNKKHSLLPCVAAHIASNIGVFAIKLAQGHVLQGLY